MVNYRPYEQNQLEALLSSGLARQDPTTAYQIFSGVQGGALQRQAERQAMNQQMMQDAISGMQNAAMTPGMTPEGLEGMLGSYQASNPAFSKPKFEQPLNAAYESLAPVVGGAGGATTLTMEDAGAIASDAKGSAEAGKTLHDARMGYMSILRAVNTPPEIMQAAYDLYGQQFQSYATNPEQLDAPITAAGASGTMTTEQPSEGLDSLFGGRNGMLMMSATGGMSAMPQLAAGLAGKIGMPQGLGGLGNKLGGAVQPLINAAGGGTPRPQGPDQAQLEDLLRSLTGSLSGAFG